MMQFNMPMQIYCRKEESEEVLSDGVSENTSEEMKEIQRKNFR